MPEHDDEFLPQMVCPRCGNVVLKGRLYCVNWLGCEWKRSPVSGRTVEP